MWWWGCGLWGRDLAFEVHSGRRHVLTGRGRAGGGRVDRVVVVAAVIVTVVVVGVSAAVAPRHLATRLLEVGSSSVTCLYGFDSTAPGSSKNRFLVRALLV